MQFTTAAGPSPLDRERVVGKPIDRIDGTVKVSGQAPYSYEYHEEVPNAAYGWIVLAGIAKGRIMRIDTAEARRAPGVLLVYTHANVPRMAPLRRANLVSQLSGPEIRHHGQAVAFVVAETLEQARAASFLIRIDYEDEAGRFDLAAAQATAVKPGDDPSGGGESAADTAVGDFRGATNAAPVTLDQTYTTPDQHAAMMEPQATTARWDGDRLTLYTSTRCRTGPRATWRRWWTCRSDRCAWFRPSSAAASAPNCARMRTRCSRPSRHANCAGR